MPTARSSAGHQRLHDGCRRPDSGTTGTPKLAAHTHGNEVADAWMVALYERDRVLMTLWSEDQGSEVPAGVKRIVLSARALKPEEGFLSLDYFFSNWERCKSHFVDSPVLATPEPHP